MTNVLEIRNLTKRFGPVTVFEKLNLSIKKGEILALVGENGAGKSTLLNVLGGVYPYGSYEGSILVDGEEKRFKAEIDSKRAGIEMIHQEISILLDLSVAENIFLGNLPSHNGVVEWKTVYEDARKYLDIVKLDIDPHEPARSPERQPTPASGDCASACE
jgi:ABC-type sugar transport system ATPase subunit